MLATGIDQSENSLQYAKTLCKGQSASFVQGSYLAPFGENAFDAALMISQDYGVLPPKERQTLLANVRRALRSGGLFALDVPTPAACAERAREPATGWESAEGGFWREEPYLTLHAFHRYPEIPAACDLYAVLTDNIAVYRIWQTFFTEESLRREMEEAGFRVRSVWGDLTGALLEEKSPVIGDASGKALIPLILSGSRGVRTPARLLAARLCTPRA